jgi:hypothetical protein
MDRRPPADHPPRRPWLWWPLDGEPMHMQPPIDAELAEPVTMGTVHLRAGPIRIAWGQPLPRKDT